MSDSQPKAKRLHPLAYALPIIEHAALEMFRDEYRWWAERGEGPEELDECLQQCVESIHEIVQLPVDDALDLALWEREAEA